MLLVRERGRRLEVFGAGDPGPAVDWLCRKDEMTVALMAPRDWWEPVDAQVERVERVEMQTLSVGIPEFKPARSTVVLRRLTAEDSEVFVSSEVAVDWALSGWETFGDLVERGAGYVVPAGARCAAAAWVYSQAAGYEAIGVSTAARFRRLGLGKAVASALVAEILHERGKIPLWTTAPGNAASWATARALGFSVVATETYLQWGRSRGLVGSLLS